MLNSSNYHTQNYFFCLHNKILAKKNQSQKVPTYVHKSLWQQPTVHTYMYMYLWLHGRVLLSGSWRVGGAHRAGVGVVPVVTANMTSGHGWGSERERE